MKHILFAVLAIAISAGTASANDSAAKARDPSWHRLLHYETHWQSPSGVRSAIHSPDFFLSISGRTDPEAELKATLSAMLEPSGEDRDTHAKCRFPARRIWLAKNFPDHRESLKPISCPNYAAWVNAEDIESVSLVFANGYMGNPASYYGHIFLKFNAKTSQTASKLVDQTVNFGAIETNQDDPLSYMIKGVVGGYDGGFSPIGFYFHNVNYGENELRDLWEYRLDLPASEVQYIISHAWELMHKRYTYYFFHDNCAFRVAELLEIVDGVDATPKNRPWIVPQAVLQTVAGASYFGKPLLANRIFHPSRQTRLHYRHTNLNSEQRDTLADIINNSTHLNGPQIQALSIPEQHAVIDTLLDYYQFRSGTKQSGVKKLPTEYIEALSARLQLPSGEGTEIRTKGTAPDVANAPSWLQIGLAQGPDSHVATTVRLRPAYYDPLDVSGAQAKHGGLSMGELQIEVQSQHVRVLHFDLVAIDSMNPAVTGLPGDKGTGWKLRAGLEQERIVCRNCLTARIQGDYSVGSTIGASNMFGAIHVGGALQGRSEFDGLGFARIGASLVERPLDNFGIRITYEVRRPLELRLAPYSVSSIETRLALAKNIDFRIRLDRDTKTRVGLGIGHYW